MQPPSAVLPVVLLRRGCTEGRCPGGQDVSDPLRETIREALLSRTPKDPWKIAHKVLRAKGEAWITDYLVNNRVRIIADLARGEIHKLRRAEYEAAQQIAEQQLKARQLKTQGRNRVDTASWNNRFAIETEFWQTVEVAAKGFRAAIIAEFLQNLDVPVFVPGEGWKSRGELSASDCRLLAADYRTRAATELGMAETYLAAADLIDEQGVGTLHEITQPSAEAA